VKAIKVCKSDSGRKIAHKKLLLGALTKLFPLIAKSFVFLHHTDLFLLLLLLLCYTFLSGLSIEMEASEQNFIKGGF